VKRHSSTLLALGIAAISAVTGCEDGTTADSEPAPSVTKEETGASPTRYPSPDAAID
jgi:hypothetical protein